MADTEDEDIVPKKHTALNNLWEAVLYGLTKPGSWSQGHIASAINGEKYDPERMYTPLDIKSAIGHKILPDSAPEQWKQLSFGKNDGNFDPGDTLDFAVDTGIGAITDPLMAAGSIARKVKTAAGLKAVAEGAKAGGPIVDGLEKLKSFVNPEKAVEGGRIAAGTMLGYNAGDYNDESGLGKYLGAVAGGAAGKFVPGAFNKGAKALGDLGDKAVGKLAAAVGADPELADYPKYVNAAADANKKAEMAAFDLKQARLKALDGLSDTEQNQVSQLMQTAKNEAKTKANAIYIRETARLFPQQYREALQQAYGDNWKTILVSGQGDDLKGLIDLTDSMYQGQGNMKGVVWNRVRELAEKEVDQKVIPKLLSDQDEKIVNGFRQWEQANKGTVEKLNLHLTEGKSATPIDKADIVKVEGSQSPFATKKDPYDVVFTDMADGRSGEGITGLKWHIDDLYPKRDPGVAGGNGQVIQRAISEKSSQAANDVAAHLLESGKASNPDQALAMAHTITYDVYANKFANAFLTDAERQARSLVQRGHSAIQEIPGVKQWDAATGFIKKNLLFNTTSWLKQNYYDNYEKAIVQNGLGGVVDGTMLKRTPKDLAADLNQIMGKDIMNQPMKSPESRRLLELGVIDGNMFRDFGDMSPTEAALRLSPEKLLEQGQKVAKSSNPTTLGEKVAATADKWTDNPFARGVATVGSDIETKARISTYYRTKEALEKSPVVKAALESNQTTPDTIERLAAKVTHDTYFNYGDLRAVEREFAKRIAPFWAFQSKNVPYWGEKFGDPTALSRIAAIKRAKDYGSESLTQDERDSLGSSYIVDNNPTVSKRETDSTTYRYWPNSSMNDAGAMSTAPFDVLLGQNTDVLKSDKNPLIRLMHPILKTGIEQLTGRDMFFKRDLDPKQSPNGRVPVGTAGYPGSLLGDLLEAAGGDRRGVSGKLLAPVGGYGTLARDGAGPQTDSEFTTRLLKATSGMPPAIPGPAGMVLNPLLMPVVKDAAKHVHAATHDGYSLLDSLVDSFGPYRETTVPEDKQMRQDKFNRRDIKHQMKTKRRNEMYYNREDD